MSLTNIISSSFIHILPVVALIILNARGGPFAEKKPCQLIIPNQETLCSGLYPELFCSLMSPPLLFIRSIQKE